MYAMCTQCFLSYPQLQTVLQGPKQAPHILSGAVLLSWCGHLNVLGTASHHMRMDRTSELISQSQLNVILYKSNLAHGVSSQQ